MVAQQLQPPLNPEDLSEEDLAAAVMAIQEKLGKKECFPDFQRIIKEVEHKVDQAKTFEDKKSYIKVAIDDFDYIVESSTAMYQFLRDWRCIDNPAPFVAYLEAADRTKKYLMRTLAHLDLEVMEAIVVPPSPAPVIGTASAVLPSKVTRTDMTTAEVAAYIHKAEGTVRHYVMDNRIPFHRTHDGAFPYFLKDEIDAWRAAGLCPSHRNKKPKAMTTPVLPPIARTEPLEEAGTELVAPGTLHAEATVNKRPIIEQLASLLAQAGHIDEPGEKRLANWIESGCNELPDTEFIDWRSGRKTLCSFIVCAYHASLLPLKIGTKKSGKPGPLYEKAIISAFLDDGKKIKTGIARTIAGPDEAIERFRSIMNASTQDAEGDAREEDTLFDNISDYYAMRKSSSFVPYREQIDTAFGLGGKKTKIFTEIEEGILKLFLKLYRDCIELSA